MLEICCLLYFLIPDSVHVVPERPHCRDEVGEARSVLVSHMATYRQLSYDELVVQRDKNLRTRLRGPSGLEYEATVRIYCDHQPNGAISAGGSIEDFGWCTYSTISEFFTMAPDGKIEEA